MDTHNPIPSAQYVPSPDQTAVSHNRWYAIFIVGGITAPIVAALVTVLGPFLLQWWNAPPVHPEPVKRAFAAELLDESARVFYALRDVRKVLVNEGVDAARPFEAKFKAALETWYQRLSSRQSKALAMFGTKVSDTLLLKQNRNLVVDRCMVLVRRNDLTGDGDCTTRLKYQVKQLTAVQDAINNGGPIPVTDPKVIIPTDFTTSVRVANSLLERMFDCRRPLPARPANPKDEPDTEPNTNAARSANNTIAIAEAGCDNRRDLQYALNLRVNRVGLLHEQLTDLLAPQPASNGAAQP